MSKQNIGLYKVDKDNIAQIAEQAVNDIINKQNKEKKFIQEASEKANQIILTTFDENSDSYDTKKQYEISEVICMLCMNDDEKVAKKAGYSSEVIKIAKNKINAYNQLSDNEKNQWTKIGELDKNSTEEDIDFLADVSVAFDALRGKQFTEQELIDDVNIPPAAVKKAKAILERELYG